MTTTLVRSAASGASQRSLQGGDAVNLFGDARPGSRHARQNPSAGGVPQSASRLLNASPPVERCSRLMQPKPRLSSSTMVSFSAEHHRGGDLGVDHEVAAVADHHDDLAFGPRQLHAEPAGDLVAHAGVAVFQVVGAGPPRLPELVQLAGQAAGGADHDRVAPALRAEPRRSPARPTAVRRWMARSPRQPSLSPGC